MAAVLKQRYATLRGVKAWNWKQNSRQKIKNTEQGKSKINDPIRNPANSF